MRTLALLVTIIVLSLNAQPPVFAQRPGQEGCGMAGSWKGETGGTSFLATYTDTAGSIAGTSDLDLWGDPTFGGSFPQAVRMTSGRGTWTRVAKATYDYQFMAVGLDSAGSPVYQLKVSGRKEMSRDCSTQTFSVTTALYAPHQDPFGSEAPLMAGPFPGAPGTARRLPFPTR
jgi:hypothetical protein